MRYFGLATDYDGTLATQGSVDEKIIRALERLVASGRRLIMVTGRELDDLRRIFHRFDLFDRIVAENGAVVFTPATNELGVLEEAPPKAFVDSLRARGVTPLSVGHVIVATLEREEKSVLAAIHELGLELHLEFNKGSLMVLPAGVSKRSGFSAALESLRLSPHNAVGIGDAENDHAFLSLCECGVAVANALPSLKERADWVTSSTHGDGVVELIDRLLTDDLASLAPALGRHRVVLGRTRAADGRGEEQATLEPYGESVLVMEPSSAGALLDRLRERRLQLCVIDPEGWRTHHEGVAAVGTAEHPPTVAEVEHLLEVPNRSVVANLFAVPRAERPHWLAAMLRRTLAMRDRTGRPHWLVVDDAHQLLPAAGDPALALPGHIGEVMLLTAHPERVSRAALEQVDVVLTAPKGAADSLRAFAEAAGRALPELPLHEGGASLVWRVRDRRALAVDVDEGPSI